MEKIAPWKIVDYLEGENILPDTLESYRPAKIIWRNIGTFAYDFYGGFQNKVETVAVTPDIEDGYSSFDVLFREV